jgi:nitrogen fixation protein NifU and related proteins
MDDQLAREMYKEHILDHYKHPHNFGNLDNPTNEDTESNPLCGDEITIQLILKDNKVEDIKFKGKGCAISMAAASLLTDKVKEMTVDQIKELKKEEILEMLMIPIGPVRIKCALISLETLRKCVREEIK